MVYLLIFLFGISLGSFLNVLIDRIPQGISPWEGRSFCDHCKKTLQWYDLIPLFSFLSLGGKCRYCHKKLSWQYPLLEIVTGILFVVTFSQFLASRAVNTQGIMPVQLLELGFALFIVSSWIVIFFTDLKFGIIPDKILFPAIIISFLYIFLFQNPSLSVHFLSGLGACLFFLVLFLGTRGKGMGFGDVKLVFLLGLVLGFPAVVLSLYISFLTGALISLILVIEKKLKLKNTIPFGPFLIGAALIVYYRGDVLIQFIRQLLPI